MRILIVSGIWPPDVGGPASHAPEVAAFLHSRGHRVEVVTTAEAAPEPRPYPVRVVLRRHLPGVRHCRGAALVHQRARGADVVYTTGMFGRSALGSSVARTPFIVKLTADPAYERARRRGIFGGSLEEFQGGGGGIRAGLLRAARNAELQRAARIICPSEYLAGLAAGWGLLPEKIAVLPNPMPLLPELPPREELRERFGLNGATLAFAGRLTRQKSLELAFEAVEANPGVSLVIAGDGDERERLERLAGERVRFLGPLPRAQVIELFKAADAALLSSSWENFPHTVVEALAVGTPVVATATGGVAEVVEDGRNGLLVPVGDGRALGDAVRRFFAEDGLRERLAAEAAPSVAAYAPDRIYTRLEEILQGAAR